MPWNPSEQNQIPQILGATTQGLEGDVSQFLQKYQEKQKQREQNQGLLDALAPIKGAIDPEVLGKWHDMTPDRQSAFLGQTIANLHDQSRQARAQQELAVRLELQRRALADAAPLRNQQTRETTAKADAAEHAGAIFYDPTTKKPAGVYDANGRVELFRQGAAGAPNEPIQIDPVIDPVTKKTKAGVGIVRKTGAPISTGDEAPGAPIIDTTGRFQYDTHLKTWKPLPPPKSVDPIKAAIASQITGTAPDAGPALAAPVTTQFQNGEVRTQNGHTYQFDGSKWNMIQ